VAGHDTIHELGAQTLIVTLVTLSLVAASVPADAYHLDLSLAHTDTVDRSGAWGASVDLAEPGTLEFVLNGYGERTSTPVSHGFALYEADGDYVGMVAVTVHDPPNRLHVSVSPTGEVVTEAHAEDGVEVSAEGDLDRLGPVELQLAPVDGDEPTEEDQPSIRSFTALHGRDAGTHKAIVWLGEAERTELELQTDATIDDHTFQAGTSHVAGDPDREQATLDVQAQESFVAGSIPLEGTQVLGGKAMLDGREHVDVDHELRGFWATTHSKTACSPEGCVGPHTLDRSCQQEVDRSCGLTSLSWQNGTVERSGQRIYSFTGTGPGSYTFSVDRKADAYEADVGPAEWEEDHSFLTVADAELPS
jgi:hypothetical protein